jgi:plastocyanin
MRPFTSKRKNEMLHKIHIRMLISGALVSTGLIAGCSTEKKEGAEGEKTETAAAPTPSAAPSTATATGDTIKIELWTDGTGNFYKPNKIEAHQGDLLRFVLKAGVHNVHFLPDSNTIKTGLPPASELLQLPEQTYDLVVTFQPGKYYFQCDPHAALGMKGHLEVEEKD